MRTVVIQSYRTTRVEPWIQRCMQSVREWAHARGYAYEFVNDALFDFLPAAIRDEPAAPLLPKTDIARLGLLADRLANAYETAIWIDADVLVFDPSALFIPPASGAMLCHEIWTSLDSEDQVVHRRGINNALMVFERGHPLLGFLRYAAIELYHHGEPVTMSPTKLGTTLLSKLGRVVPLRLHTQVACLSPMLVSAACHGHHPEWLQAHAQQHGHRFAAANLCRSLLTDPTLPTRHAGDLDEDQMQQFVEQLIATRGHILRGEALIA